MPGEQREWLTIVVVGAGPDRRRDRGPGPRARDAQPARRVPQLRSRRRCACCSSTAARSRWPRSATTSRERRRASSRRSASSCGWAHASPASTRSVSTSHVERRHASASRPAPWCGRRACRPRRSRRCSPTATGAEVDRAGRIAVLPDLTLPGHPEVFAVGDMVDARTSCPGVAEVAMQGSLHAANTIARRLTRRRRGQRRSRYRDLGSVATIGRFRAICSCAPASASAASRRGSCGCSCTSRSSTGSATASRRCRRWLRSMVGRSRAERVFSVGAHRRRPQRAAEVLVAITPNQFPADPNMGR